MVQIGRSTFSYKIPDANRFGGMSFESSGEPYQFDLLENCYVSGGEIRAFPGSVCVLDPVSDARLATDVTPFSPRGYDSDHYDARRPTYTASLTYKIPTTPTESQIVWTRPTTLHSVHFLANRWVFVGESDGRREPIYNSGRTQWVYVTSYQGNGAGTAIDLTLSQVPSSSANTFNAVTAARTIYLEGLTGDHASLLNNKQHNVTSVSSNVIRVSTSYTGSHAAFTGQTGFISVVTASYNFNQLGIQNSYEIGEDVESLTVWRTATNSVNQDAPDDLVYCSHVANRRRDFGDSTGVITEGSQDNQYSRRRQKSLPYRVVPHKAGSRIIVAAPGYGCTFQIPNIIPSALNGTAGASGVGSYSNGDIDQPRCLGVPKAVALEDPDKTVSSSAHIFSSVDAAYGFGGTDVSMASRAGTYKFKFAYRDDATGEIGIPSEEVEVTTNTATYAYQGLRFFIYFPGYLMPECLAYSILAYRTKAGSPNGEFYFDSMVKLTEVTHAMGAGTESGKYGLTPEADSLTYGHFFHVSYSPLYKTDDELEEQSRNVVVPDGNKQMPMGCKTAYTYRGFTMFGGALGDSGPYRELQSGQLETRYTRVSGGLNALSYWPDRIWMRFSTVTNCNAYSEAAGFNLGSAIIPPAYAGQTIYCPTILPYPRTTVVMDEMVNTFIGTADVWYSQRNRIPDVCYRVLETPINSKADYNTQNGTCYLMLPRNQVQISNPDHPGETPAVNTLIVANEEGEDVEAMGSYNGQPVLATRSKTYMVGFSTTPVGAVPDIVSDKFGCIAPNTMVEFDGGCAWISDRGPVAIVDGGFRWIGKPLQKWFSESTGRYKKDSLGMMRHAWGCHDPVRGLIYFGLFADLAAGTDNEVTVTYLNTTYNWTDTNSVGSILADKVRSRFACDEVLVYSYRDDAWSVWRPPQALAVQWMTVGLDQNKTQRVFYLGSDKRLYALDDLWGLTDQECNYTDIAQTGSTTTITGLTTGYKMLVGMDVAFYKGGSGTRLEFLGLRTIASKTDTEIVLDSAITLPVGGCKMLVGPRRMKIRTNWAAWKQSDQATVAKAGLRYSQCSLYSLVSTLSEKQASFVKGTLRSASLQNGILTRKESTLTGNTYSPLGEDVTDAQTFDYGLAQGMAQGQSFQLEVEFVGGSQVRLQDLFVEVG